jgi:hypothetical protein
MALGFATSEVVFPGHTQAYPSTNRMSALTCMSTPLRLCFAVDAGEVSSSARSSLFGGKWLLANGLFDCGAGRIST